MRPAKIANAASFEAVYHQSRRLAICLSLASAGDEATAYALSTKAHAWALGRSARKARDVSAVLGRLYRSLPRTVKDSAQFADLHRLDKEARSVYALLVAGGLEKEQVRSILGLNETRFEQARLQADQALDEAFTQAFTAEVDRMLMRKEIWSDVLFVAGRKQSTGRKLRLAFGALLAAFLLFALGREVMALVKITVQGMEPGPALLSSRYQEEDFYKRRLETMSLLEPRLAGSLLDSLQDLPEDQLVRVAFRYYDRQAMLGIREQGSNLEDLYVALFKKSQTQGQINTLVANAIIKYFDAYQRPFQVRQRTEDFKSRYDSIYQAALELSEGSGFARIVAEHQEIFGSKEQFDAYLYGRLFINQAPQIFFLLRAHYILDTAVQSGQPVDQSLREDYEDAIFAFTNPVGLNGRFNVAPYAFLPGENAAFFAIREHLGKQLYEANVASCLKALPEEAQANSDILEGSESSLFSASLTKKEILRLAKTDSRFEFLGLAVSPGPLSSLRMESELYHQAREGLFKKHQVYRLDEEYRLYSINYAAPLALPRGFIRDLRSIIDCQDTQFEMEIQYNYHMRYAHPEERLGYSLLRKNMLSPDIAYTTSQYKSFYKMSRD